MTRRSLFGALLAVPALLGATKLTIASSSADPYLAKRIKCPEFFEYLGLVTVEGQDDIYALHTDRKTHTARALTNVTRELKMQIRAYEQMARPIDTLMKGKVV